MASSDDEQETLPYSVTGYYFLDDSDSPVSFEVLPIQFDDAGEPDACDIQVFLHGSADGGLQKICKQVIAWKLQLQGQLPEVYVLSKDNLWIKLQKARKSYEESVRTTLVTIQVLHYLRKNPETSEKILWDHLRKKFSVFDVRPSEGDLLNHRSLIKHFSERDEILGRSKIVPILLACGEARKTNSLEVVNKDQDMKPFIVEDVEFDDSDEESDLFDSVCAICDNGGELLCCEGKCLRSFHATKKAGEESKCKSLGFTRADVKAIQSFLCKNCEYKQHQCFACGKLGPSDKSINAEVFECVNATCGHFYHPKCVAELLFPENKVEALEYEKRIASGESFTCPVHKCNICKQVENKEVKELQFAICRRCPKSYHRKCLPRKIGIASEDDGQEGIVQRAWEGLLPNRILIYCLKHKLDGKLGTPIRNHIVFPQTSEEEKLIDMQKTKAKIPAKKVKEASGGTPKEWVSSKPKKVAERHSSAEEMLPAEKRGGSIGEQFVDHQKKVKPLKDGPQHDSRNFPQHLSEYEKSSKDQPKNSVTAVAPAPIGNEFDSSFPSIDTETQKRVLTLMEKASTSITLQSIIKKRVMPSTHAYSARHVDKSISYAKVEGFVEAICTALKNVECSGSVDDAKAVCQPEILKQIGKWNNKLKVYLAPFLHGLRYTSFGRHFTKVDKLKEIVDLLQWYVQSGDTIVDFCCGANDFSQLMKEKLEAVGKQCSFKNYDVIQPKNDFCFEKRDWMKVRQKDLPTGSQLIMGLNPPFGVKASLANKFIDKALSFKPKLLILIVPSETIRLDGKEPKYDLILEDGEKLSGKSFYLPGSVDVNEEQLEQWNSKPPILYLWSRPDWTAKHKAIAARHNHKSTGQRESSTDEPQNEPIADARLLYEEGNHVTGGEIKGPDHSSKGKAAGNDRVCRESSKIAEHSTKRKPAEENRASRESSKSADHRTKSKTQKENEVKGDDSTGIDHSKKRKLSGNEKGGSGNRGKLHRTESFDRGMVDETSDMSISPPFEAVCRNPLDIGQASGAATETLFEAISRHQLDVHQTSGGVEKPFESDVPRNSFSELRSDFGTGSGGLRNTTGFNDDIDGVANRYAFNNGSFYRASSELRGFDHHMRTSDDRPSSYSRDGYIDVYGRRSLTGDLENYGRLPEVDLHSQHGLYNQHGVYDSAPMNRYPVNVLDSMIHQHPPSMGPPDSFGQYPSSVVAPDVVRSLYVPQPNYRLPNPVMGSSAMQRYAPRLDETNFAPIPGRSGYFDSPDIRRGTPPDSMGFAPGPHQSYSHHGSSGWLDD
ncbi:protein ENHANCED DOWNY MILDEW 2-like [Dioscorea cayenensis subsp. rotundata]|uniref:Protein ENHANCED DOWNY MILDEW 2-like n=1 Tax=Dioscorea cayennensis subsp. rotundata TaxID=55577 RepID=A0AB40CU65_DIOCR|nr:protein ENHANCED DOWNY MILDEW 2-like [Dioscorea cayenensis subsp. rotundata]XP_039141584.1 protein ENHANCED DOWNY MILDEW 2-like [Dioscorea cayenensis subsp. rotundata]